MPGCSPAGVGKGRTGRGRFRDVETRLTLDRFEGYDKRHAVLVADDGRRSLVLTRDMLPPGTRCGDLLRVDLASTKDGAGPGPGGPAVGLNAASAEVLTTLPGVGPVLAGRIVAARPFPSIGELSRVEGLGAVALGRLRPLVSAGPAAAADRAPESPLRLRVETPAEGPGAEARLVTEDGREALIPDALMPDSIRAGEWLTLTLALDPEATRQVAEEVRSLQEKLKARDPGGDIVL